MDACARVYVCTKYWMCYCMHNILKSSDAIPICFVMQTMADRRKKFAVEKKRLEEEMEEVKQNTEVRTYFSKGKYYCVLRLPQYFDQAEINSIRERYRREKTQSDSTLSVQISRAEQEVEERWQAKADRMVSQAEDRWRHKYDELKEELRESNNSYHQAIAKVMQNNFSWLQ